MLLVSPKMQFGSRSVVGSISRLLMGVALESCHLALNFRACDFLQHPSPFPLPGIRGQSKETFPLLLLPELCGLPKPPQEQRADPKARPSRQPLPALALPILFRVAGRAFTAQSCSQGFVFDIWEMASAALINTACYFAPLALRLLLIDIFESVSV